MHLHHYYYYCHFEKWLFIPSVQVICVALLHERELSCVVCSASILSHNCKESSCQRTLFDIVNSSDDSKSKVAPGFN